jgi:hypothetical protein
LVRPSQTRYFVTGLYVGAAFIAVAIGSLGNALASTGLRYVTAAIAIVGGLVLIGSRVIGRPWIVQNARQVPSWLTETHPAGFLVFGFEMGTGMRTYSPTALPHILALSVFAVASPWAVTGAALGFATGRALMIWLFRRRGNDPSFAFAMPVWAEIATMVIWAGSVSALYLAL